MDLQGKFAVITGGGSGIGQELARLLVSRGCHVAVCGTTSSKLETTRTLCADASKHGARIVTCIADVANETQVIEFRDKTLRELDTDHINLLVNNAGIGAGASFIMDAREKWDRTFNVNWYGVYYCSRAFLPDLLAADEGKLVNVSSATGIWATSGYQRPTTAYSTGKFAVRGFTESLIDDFRVHAPHIQPVLVFPGYTATDVFDATLGIKYEDEQKSAVIPGEIERARRDLAAFGIPNTAEMDESAIIESIESLIHEFKNNAPMTAAQVAEAMLEGIQSGQWRILIGKDVEILDRMVRKNPGGAYQEEFNEQFLKEAGWM